VFSVKQSCLLIIITAIFNLAPVYGNVKSPLTDAWVLLLNNQPDSSEKAFSAYTGSSDTMIAAEARRGLSAVNAFTGNFVKVVEYGFDAFVKDQNAAIFSAWPELLESSRFIGSSSEKKIIKILQKFTDQSGLFSGWFQDALMQIYREKGQTQKAISLGNKMGIIRQWKCIGPFENVSNCGFSKSYFPEKELLFNKMYVGKNGDSIQWHSIDNQSSRGWLFLDNYASEYNAVYYFYCNVNSPEERIVNCAFGASGTFQIFLNGAVVLQDSVYRNTGIDAFMQKVTLRKGDNSLLIKIGHESGSAALEGKSNFLIRFLDKNYGPVSDLSINFNTGKNTNSTDVYSNLTASPIVDSISTTLISQLKENENNIDALFSLINLYNVYERTNDAQKICLDYIKKYPSSSILYSKLAEAQIRAQKVTEYGISMNKAFELCNINMIAWSRQLEQYISNQNVRSIEEFLAKSDKRFLNTAHAAIARLNVAFFQKNKSGMMDILIEIDKKYSGSAEAIELLVPTFESMGFQGKAERMLLDYIKKHRTATHYYSQLSELYQNQGKISKAVSIYMKALKYEPVNPGICYNLSNIYYSAHSYGMALKYVNKCLETIPNSATLLNLKGNILQSMGDKNGAIQTFQKTIDMTSDDFNAWEKIRALNGSKSLEQLAPLPEIDSLTKKSKDWIIKNNDNKAVIVSYVSDMFTYPSKAARSRVFIVVYLPNQNEIDQWKEYEIGYNSNYQSLNIDRALTKKSNGAEVQADHNGNYIVFKSLEPGDYILLEYSLRDYYEGKMAGKVYGKESFESNLSVYDFRVRFVTPSNDTIPYIINGDSIVVQKAIIDDYAIITLKKEPSVSTSVETFTPTDCPDYKKVWFSNFTSWGDIVEWYYEISSHKQNQTMELRDLADSLLVNCSDKKEMAHRIHSFITNIITYSHVPFRQSAWIPQSAGDVYATRIGDCKDMASLGKCLMGIAGIESYLVLVNTQEHLFNDHAYVGPDFDHCILAYYIDGKEFFVDFTSRSNSLDDLPIIDQGAMALVIKPGNDELISLPLDLPEERGIIRRINIKLSEDGSMRQEVATLRTGTFASILRSIYRFQTEKEMKQSLQKSLSDRYQNINIDSMNFANLDTLTDTISHYYSFDVKNMVDINGKTAIYSLYIPDIITSDNFPMEEKRRLPIDMTMTYIGISEMKSTFTIDIPGKWALLDKPKDVEIHTDNASYSLQFKVNGRNIVVTRYAKMNYRKLYKKEDFESDLALLNKAVKSDNVKLLFTVN
jgi:tetratricopeptide (TPR) repeat protein